MKVKLLIGVLVALIVLNLATIGSFVVMRWRASASDTGLWPPGDGRVRWSPPGGERPRARRSFRLPAEERGQLRSLLNEFRSESEALRQKIREDENLTFELMQREEVPRAQVDSLLEEITKARLESGRLAVDKLIESKAYLTPQQQKLFFESILQIRPSVGMRRGWSGHIRGGEQRGKRGGGERL